jgi:hypothetical protein
MGIARYGAGKEFGIADVTAGQTQDLAKFGATENRGISDYSSAGTKGISDFSSLGTRTISGNDATARRDISTFGAGANRTLADSGADAKLDVTKFGASEARNIGDSAASRGLAFYSNDLQRRLSALSLPAAAIDQEFKVRTAADQYGNSGFTMGMNNLQGFRTNAGAAPATQTDIVKPITSGMEVIGPAMVQVAGNIAKSQNYWSNPTPATVKNTAAGASFAGTSGAVGTDDTIPTGL